MTQHKRRLIQSNAKGALRCAFERAHPDISLDDNGYTPTNEANLIDGVYMDDFEEDLRQGDGNELDNKFRAAHSSSALAANCFGPFKRHLSDLCLLDQTHFDCIQLEKKCPTGISTPNLDVVIRNQNVIIGIESKLIEYLDNDAADFRPSYQKNQQNTWCRIWIREKEFLRRNPRHYQYLDAAQLVKHAFGMGHTFHNEPAPLHLLYLYWEPENAENHPVFRDHRKEIRKLSCKVAGATPSFTAMTYADLWGKWENKDAPDWLKEHIKRLRARYAVTV